MLPTPLSIADNSCQYVGIVILGFLYVAKRLRVYVRSEGCDDKVRGRRVPGCGRARFKVNGRDYSPPRGHRGRGFNVLVINGMTGK